MKLFLRTQQKRTLNTYYPSQFSTGRRFASLLKRIFIRNIYYYSRKEIGICFGVLV